MQKFSTPNSPGFEFFYSSGGIQTCGKSVTLPATWESARPRHCTAQALPEYTEEVSKEPKLDDMCH